MMLTRDEQPLTCPVATRVLIPGRMANTLDVNQAMCGSHCALFKTWINEITDKWHVKLCQQEHIIDGKNVEKTSSMYAGKAPPPAAANCASIVISAP